MRHSKGGKPTEDEVLTARFRLRSEQQENVTAALAAAAVLSGSEDKAENLDTMAREFLAMTGEIAEAESPRAPGNRLVSNRLAGRATRCWRAKRPPEDEFYVRQDHWDQLCYAVYHGMNCLVTGPAGCGKTEICDRVGVAAGRPIVSFNCGAMSEPRSTLIGNVHFDRAKGTWFSESRFVRAIQRRDTGIKLDEISRLQRDGFNILLPLLDGQSYLALDEHEDGAVVRLAEGVFFMATANLGQEYTRADELDKALKDRFGAVIDLSFPPASKELAVLKRRCPGLENGHAKRLIEVASRQREMAADGEFMELISTRALIHASKEIAAGIPFEQAVTYCIMNHFSGDGGEVSERAKLAQIIQKGGLAGEALHAGI
jgi:MoxR-like ATPase